MYQLYLIKNRRKFSQTKNNSSTNSEVLQRRIDSGWKTEANKYQGSKGGKDIPDVIFSVKKNAVRSLVIELDESKIF